MQLARDAPAAAPGIARSLALGSWLAPLAIGLALLACYHAGAALGFTTGGMAWPFWPGNGIAFAIIARRPRREWPACALAQIAGELLGGHGVGTPLHLGTVLYALLDAGESTLAAALLRRAPGVQLDLRSFRAVGRFLGAALVAVTATALAAALVATLRGVRQPVRFLGNFWVGDALGFLVAGQALLRLLQPRSRPAVVLLPRARPRAAEAAGLAILLVAVTVAGFIVSWPTGSYALVHAVVPLLAWSALRFGPSGGAWGLVLVAALGTVLTPLGLGPFAHLGAHPDSAFASMQLFLAFVAVTTLLFGAAVSELRGAEEARSLAQAAAAASSRMELVGRLAGGVAHDFNNVLTVVTAHSDLVLLELPAGHPNRLDLEAIRHAADSGAGMTRQLLALARHQPTTPRLVDLGHVVTGMERMLRRLAGEEVRLTVRVGPERLPVMADPVALERVLYNLVSNSRDALPPGGSVEVEASGPSTPPPASELAPALHAVLRVTDTGRGMDAEALAHLFEPFFTTKEPGKGTGLGLANVRQLVEQAHGWVGVESAAGRGTSVSVWLPCADGQVLDGTQAAEGQQRAALSGLTLLVVDDDSAVRQGLLRLLTQRGALVHGAASGADALSVVERHGDELDAVLADLPLPGASGARLLRRLVLACPRAQLVVMARRFDAADAMALSAMKDDVVLLAKPFTVEDLAERLRRGRPFAGG